MAKIEIEIRECENGFILEDNYECEEIFFKTYEQALAKANKIFLRFKDIEIDREKEAD